MAPYVTEPSRRIPVVGDFDVVVVGAGIAGVAAAVAAVRAGASVALIEKTCSPGGLATLANVVYYLPLCDGRGNQVIGGLGEELLKLSVADGAGEIPPCWRPGGDPAERAETRYRVRFNPASYLLALERLLVEEGVRIFYDTLFCDVEMSGSRIDAVIVENKSGRSALRTKTVVDASGDADVCARVGEETVSLTTNGAAAWFFYEEGGKMRLCGCHVPFDVEGGPPPNGERGYAGDDARDVTDHVLESRALVREKLRELGEEPGRAVQPLLIPTIPSFRMTRRLKGEVELETGHAGRSFPDAIGLTGDWKEAGPVYQIPLRALVATRTDNLVTAGRCISSAGAWDVTRVIPPCAVTGQAAGLACAMATRREGPRIRDLDVGRLQEGLREQDVLLEPE